MDCLSPSLSGRITTMLLLLLLLPLLLTSPLTLAVTPTPGESLNPSPSLERLKEAVLQQRALRSNYSRLHSSTRYSALLLPVGPPELIRSAQQTSWFRAVFQKNPSVRAGLRVKKAQLKLSSEQVRVRARVRVRPEPGPEAGGVKISGSDRTVGAPALPRSSAPALVSVDLRAAVRRWLSAGAEALQVDVEARGGVSGSELVLALELVLSGPRSGSRTRRSSREEQCGPGGRCCRTPLPVSLRELGWSDWVVAPAQLLMHFCDGSCPHNYRPASAHAQARARLHRLSQGALGPPCCVPGEFEPVALMIRDSRGRLKLSVVPDLLVSKCHCA